MEGSGTSFDQFREYSRRVDHLEAEVAHVRQDVAGVKTALDGIAGKLDELRTQKPDNALRLQAIGVLLVITSAIMTPIYAISLNNFFDIRDTREEILTDQEFQRFEDRYYADRHSADARLRALESDKG